MCGSFNISIIQVFQCLNSLKINQMIKRMPKLLFTVTILSLFLFSCQEDETDGLEVNQLKGRIVFNMDIVSDQLKSSSPEDFTSLSTAIVSISTAEGDSSLLEFEPLKLFRIGSALFTEELVLPNNQYVLTHFFLQDSTGNTLYACPQEGSEQAQNVTHPVPIEFTVLPGETTPVSVEVLSTQNLSPDDFGFSYFEVGFVETLPLLISAVDSESFNPLVAQINIQAGTNYSFSTTLDDLRFNTVQIKDGFDLYTITVTKDGYESVSDDYSLDEIKTYLESPLMVVLELKDVNLEGNMVLNYPLNGNFFDYGVNGYHLSGGNIELCGDRFGVDSMAFSFTGDGGLTYYNTTIIDQSEPQTLTAWFKTNDSNQNPEFGGFIAIIIGSEGAGAGSRFSINMKDGYLRANYGDGYDELDQMYHDQLLSEVQYNDGEWHMAALVSNGDYGQLSLFVDGELIDQKVSKRSNNNQVDGLDIKIGGDSYRSYFSGSIDEVSLYNKALNEAEIKYLYSGR